MTEPLAISRGTEQDQAQDRRDYTFDDPEAELVLLARALSLSDPDRTLLASVPPQDFADPACGTIWAAARAITDAGGLCTRSRIIDQIQTTGTDLQPSVINSRLGAAGLRGATDRQAADAVRTVRHLAERRRLRGALQAAMFALDTGQDASSTTELLGEHLRRLDDTNARPDDDVLSFGDAVQRWRDRQDHPAAAVVPTPWSELNELLSGGLQAGRTYIVAARPGEGKSILGANAALHAAESGHPALVFSAEMPVHEVAARMIASGARANYGQLTRRMVDAHNRDRIRTYLTEHETNLPLWIVDKTNISTEYIAATSRRIQRRHGLKVVFVDYLQLLRETDSRAARERQVAAMSRALKIMAVELDIAVVIACQLNRGSAGDKRMPALTDLRESGAIEQDSDVVLLLHHELDGDGNRVSGEVTVIVGKNRTGRAGGHERLDWIPQEARMGDQRNRRH